DADAKRFQRFGAGVDAWSNARRRRQRENGSRLHQGADPLARSLLFLPGRVGVALRYRGCERHSLADAGTELRLIAFDERPVDAPDLARLDDAKTFAPGIEAARRDGFMAGLGEVARHRVDGRAQQGSDLRIGLGECVVENDQLPRLLAYA